MQFSTHFLLRRAGRGMAVMLCVGAATAWATTMPFDFVSYGNFKKMVQTGDTAGQVRLADVPHAAGTWGVGALAGLTGEIIVVDGRLLVSRGDDRNGLTTAPRPDDQAVLFAAARVREWRAIALPSDMTQAQFETFVVDQAKSYGVNTDRPFPFVVDGVFNEVTWHVVTGQRAPSGHGGSAAHGAHGGHAAQDRHGLADMHVFNQVDVSGTLVALYSGAHHAGIITHPGQSVHAHFVDPTRQASGHIDAYRLRKGALLRLPVE